jgi:hypothetical protein
MRNFIDALAILDLRVNDPNPMLEERRQMTAGEITVFVDGGGQHRAAMFPIPRWIIGAAAEERDTKGSSANNHGPIVTAPDLNCLSNTDSLSR